MAMTVAAKEEEVVAAAIAITLPHCNTGITEDNLLVIAELTYFPVYKFTFLVLRITP